MILIADEIHPDLMKGLKDRQIEFNYQPGIELSEVLDIISNYEGIIIRSKFFISKEFINEAPNLKFIARAGSGTDNIDSEYAAEKGITILNAPEGLADSVAEHTIGLILALQHKIVQSNKQVKKMKWNREENRGFELMNSTVGIIGYGNTGSAVAKKLSGFGVKVLTYDKYKIPQKGDDGQLFFDAHATFCSLEAIYDKIDILTMHVPLTTETTAWVNRKFLERFKKPIVFINCARGQIVNTLELTKAIKEGKVKAAALDVLELEPPFEDEKESPLWFNTLREMDNVILTPHIAGWTEQSYERISEVLCRKIIEFYDNGRK